MATISISATQYRNDSTVYPRVNIAGYANRPYIKLADWQYFSPFTDGDIIEPNNRSMKVCPVYLRDCKYDFGNYTLDAPGGGFSITPTVGALGFIREGGSVGGSWNGGYYNLALTGNIVTIQAQAQSISLSAGISLQDTPFVTHDYFNPAVAHSLIFGQNGKLSIREKGNVPTSLVAAVRYEIGDIGMIELDKIKNVVRYYLIKGKKMILLRTTRPKLLTNPIAEFMLFYPDSALEQVLIHSGPQVMTTFENIGVATRKANSFHFQKWKNPRTRVSTADPIQLADGEFEYTFPSSKTVLRQIALTPGSYDPEGFQILEDFFNWHGNEKEFIFVDTARKDSFGHNQEYWARFLGGQSDQTGNGCIFDDNVQLVEAYRGDYVPQLLDEGAPIVTLGTNAGSSGIAIYTAHATDDVGVRFCRLFVDGIQKGIDNYYNGSDDFGFTFNTAGMSSGSHSINVRAFDYAGNSTLSNTRTLVI